MNLCFVMGKTRNYICSAVYAVPPRYSGPTLLLPYPNPPLKIPPISPWITLPPLILPNPAPPLLTSPPAISTCNNVLLYGCNSTFLQVDITNEFLEEIKILEPIFFSISFSKPRNFEPYHTYIQFRTTIYFHKHCRKYW